MLRLLNERDQEVLEKVDTRHRKLVKLTTPGLGLYRCGNCQYFEGVPFTGEKNCKDLGVNENSMPCAYNGKRPEIVFRPKDMGNVRLAGNMELDELILLSILVEAEIKNQEIQHRFPYKLGARVRFIRNHALVDGVVEKIEPDRVTVLVVGTPDDRVVLPPDVILPTK